MQIQLVSTDKKRFLPLLLLADEQESMIDRYLERGDLYVMYDKTDEGKGIRELKNLAVAPHWQRKGYGRQMVEYLCQRYQNVCHTLMVGTGDSRMTISFYQSCGFVYSHTVPDFFTLHYDHPIVEDEKILKDMTIPEGEKPTVYETLFIYSKDGKEQEFTIDNFPTDTTWTFVDSKTRVKEKGYEPPIHDFSITSLETGEDLTDDILHSEQYTFLLVAPWLKQADDSGMDLINEVYDYSVEHGYRFLCLTASSEQDITDWQENTGAEYPFALMDEITLKTMIRSNPGLILLKKGVVLRKWSVSNLPDEYQLNAPLEKLPFSTWNPKTSVHKVVEVTGWFLGPLLLLTVVDLIWLRIKSRKKKKEKENKKETL